MQFQRFFHIYICVFFLIFNAEDISTHATSKNNEEKYCRRPDEPANGHFSCETNDVIQDTDNNQLFSPGSICQVKCKPTHSIPFHLYKMSMIECQNGDWNITGIEFCYKEQPMRRRAAQRHRMRKKSTKQLRHQQQVLNKKQQLI